jgi:hypothetical protein
MITAVIQRRHAKFYLEEYHFLQLMISSSCFLAGTISISENMFFRILLSLLPKPIVSVVRISVYFQLRTHWMASQS